MKISLTIFLMQKTITSLDAASRVCKLSEYKLMDSNSEELKEIAQCFAKSSPARPPRWAKFYSDAFNIPPELLRTRSSSLIIFLKTQDRVFAITSGHGHQSIPRSAVESDFGLRATLNAIKPTTLRSLQSRTIDPLTVQRMEVSNRETSLQSFVLDQERELLAKLEGTPENETDGIGIAGSNSVQLHKEAECNDLPGICARLLSLSKGKKYKENFKFIDQIKRIQDTNYISSLNEIAVAALRGDNKNSNTISLAIPSI